MDVRIGIAQTGQVIELELADDIDRAELKKQVDATLADEAAVLWLIDRKGKVVGLYRPWVEADLTRLEKLLDEK